MAPPPVEGSDPTSERRRSRTSDPLLSLSRLFESARKRGALDTLVLADESGLAIAGAGTQSACDELAAAAPFSKAANDTVPCRLDVVSRSARIRRLRIDGVEVVLCAEGGGPEALSAIVHAASGCERILTEGRRHAAGGETTRNSLPVGGLGVAKRGSAT